MSSALLRNRWTAWIAAWAMLLSALVPAAMHGRVAGQSSLPFAAEVCMTRDDGHPSVSRKLALPDAPVQPKAVHCPLCVVGGSLPGLPPMAWHTPLLALPSEPVPHWLLHAPRPLYAWAVARARAPPPPHTQA